MSWIRVVKATIITVVISVICFLPPGVHFVTGPLSPLIGGYFAGNRTHLDGAGATLVGLLLAVVIGIPLPWLLRAVNFLPDIEPAALIFFSVFAALWFGVLGGVAVALGGHTAAGHDSRPSRS